jgi:hypothetical protein
VAKLYRITPLEKKSVEYFVDVYEELADGTIRGFDVTEIYRWGQGFRELDHEVYSTEVDRVHCDPQVGWGCELDDLCGVYVNFTDGFTEEEKAEIEARCRGELEDEDGRWGTAWIYDGDHNWQIEDNCVYILGPVKIDIVNEEVYNEIVEEGTPLVSYSEYGTEGKFYNEDDDEIPTDAILDELNYAIGLDGGELEGLDESKKSGVSSSLKKKSQASGIPMGILRKVFAKGMQAWNAGHRPGVAQHQWGMGRVNSFITGAGGARKADADLWTKAKAAKARKKKK